jgi:hypothetical protein
MLPEHLRFACLMESFSRHPVRRTSSLSLHRVPCQGMIVIEEAQSVLFLNGCTKLSRRLARYYLATALFQSPLSERSVTVSVSRRLSSSHSCRLAATSDGSRTTLALRISRTVWRLRSDHLCPFALGMALPSALVDRYFHDYYGHSVSLEVSLLRRIPCSVTMRRV